MVFILLFFLWHAFHKASSRFCFYAGRIFHQLLLDNDSMRDRIFKDEKMIRMFGRKGRPERSNHEKDKSYEQSYKDLPPTGMQIRQ